MILIKCSCGCFFTLKDEGLEERKQKRCLNCGKVISIDDYTSAHDIITELLPNGIEVKCVPDNAKISITFEV